MSRRRTAARVGAGRREMMGKLHRPHIGETNVPSGYSEFPKWFAAELEKRMDEDWLAGINLGTGKVNALVRDKLTPEEQQELDRWLMSISIYGCFYEHIMIEQRKLDQQQTNSD